MAAKIINLGLIVSKMPIISQTLTFEDKFGVPSPSLTLSNGMLYLMIS